MEYLLLSFVAGILTVLAPCVLPLLPVTLGGSIVDGNDRKKPLLIILGLATSTFVFTLLLKASTLLIMVDPLVWKLFSGLIIIMYGVITIRPTLWEHLASKFSLSTKSGTLLNRLGDRNTGVANVLAGAALGPVFASCSPTYFLIIGIIIPQNFVVGIINLLVYVFGLCLVLLLIALFGQRLVKKLRFTVSADGKFRLIMGILIIIAGISIVSGLDKKISELWLDLGLPDITKVETRLLER